MLKRRKLSNLYIVEPLCPVGAPFSPRMRRAPPVPTRVQSPRALTFRASEVELSKIANFKSESSLMCRVEGFKGALEHNFQGLAVRSIVFLGCRA